MTGYNALARLYSRRRYIKKNHEQAKAYARNFKQVKRSIERAIDESVIELVEELI